MVKGALSILLIIKDPHKRLFHTLCVLSVIIPLTSYAGYALFHVPSVDSMLLFRLYGAGAFTISLLLLELLVWFFRGTTFLPHFHRGKMRISLQWIWRPVYAAALGGILFLPWASETWRNSDPVFVINTIGKILYGIHLLFTVLIFYLLESAYRFAVHYQRYTGKIFFLSFVMVQVAQLFVVIRTILYSTVHRFSIDTLIVAYGICVPVMLTSFLRYRLWKEKITVSRQAVYSSFTLFFIGSVLSALGVTVLVIRAAGVAFTYFELFLPVFSLLFFLVMGMSSGRMRKRIASFVNRRFYRRKYDYYEQFFRLHETYKPYSELHQLITDLLCNLEYTLILDEATVFLMDHSDNNFYFFQDAKHSGESHHIMIGSDSPLVAALKETDTGIDLRKPSFSILKEQVFRDDNEFSRTVGRTVWFPIQHYRSILGLLAIEVPYQKNIDNEDVRIIQAYTLSIANVVFKDRLLHEQIEQKQFESFSRVTSFIIHDIKNQVATLSLITKNAEKNITNPDFQKSLVRSLNHCVTNFQDLIDKLVSPPAQTQLCSEPQDIASVVTEVVTALHITTMEKITANITVNTGQTVTADRKALYYIILNLVKNALEAMDFCGTLTITANRTVSVPITVKKDFQFSDQFLARYTRFLLVHDTGKGMTKEFTKNHLFRPFSSNKDKGIGIGLYQCKMLIEKMHGKIVCHSQPGNGTTFCMLLQ